MFFGQVVFYIYLIGRSITIYHYKAKQEYSYTNTRILNWFYLFILTISVFPLSIFLLSINNQFENTLILPFVLCIFTFVIILIILARPEIYQGVGMVVSSGTRKDGHLFTLKDRESLYNKLLDHMESNKIYLNSKLKIKDLSDILDTNPTYLSQAINSQSKRSFFDFINMYRIEYAKKLLSNKDYSKYTIEAIAKESGFNSRSVFYTAFKKFSDSSPSDYLEKHSDRSMGKNQ